MKVYTSYFYKIRFFAPNEIPISTVVWDPKWYHEFKEQTHTFIDARGVVNGLRCRFLEPDDTCKNLCRGPETCSELNPKTCNFLRAYQKQLDKISYEKFKDYLDRISEKWKTKFKTDEEPVFVFMFHETPNNPCSERSIFVKWCKANKIECEEWGI